MRLVVAVIFIFVNKLMSCLWLLCLLLPCVFVQGDGSTDVDIEASNDSKLGDFNGVFEEF